MRYQGQYFDEETGLCYNRFRYFDSVTGLYISQEPIRLQGGTALYGYVKDSNVWVDIFGLNCGEPPESKNAFDLITENPASIWGKTHTDLQAMLGPEWQPKPYKGTSDAVILTNGSCEITVNYGGGRHSLDKVVQTQPLYYKIKGSTKNFQGSIKVIDRTNYDGDITKEKGIAFDGPTGDKINKLK